MKRVEFLALVLASVNFLKEKATASELSNLAGLETISRPYSESACILGLMTGRHNSDRAKEISEKILFCDKAKFNELNANKVNLQEGVGIFGHSPQFTENYLEILTTAEFEGQDAYAPFEIFILMDGANTPDLLKYLRGEAETFEPTFNELATA